jgi:hypothetical protein
MCSLQLRGPAGEELACEAQLSVCAAEGITYLCLRPPAGAADAAGAARVRWGWVENGACVESVSDAFPGGPLPVPVRLAPGRFNPAVVEINGVALCWFAWAAPE